MLKLIQTYIRSTRTKFADFISWEWCC